MERKKYPIRVEDYEILDEIGQGGSASVHRALCIPFNEVVAIKIIDFEGSKSNLSNISREAQTMILVDHPNVLRAHCSFVSDHNLWVVMPYMAGGSVLHILKAAYPNGLKEVIIATILRETLKGLEYLHHHGHIHRDVKAGNILVDVRGGIKLGDFGVTACLFDSCDRQRVRNSFVGTPCWMAPEVMEQLHGYDFKADIWSFGITALELAHGHAPFSKYPPMKVLLMTLQNAPPGLDYESDKKFSKSFKQMIATCLVKDPSKRPSAQKLLKHSFFKQARSNDYIARKILDGLPCLSERIEALKIKEANMLAQKKMPDGQKEEISQNEYKRGISEWNFNIEDLKAEASLIQDVEEVVAQKDNGGCSSSLACLDSMLERQSHCPPSINLAEEDNMKKMPAPLFSDLMPNNLKGRYDSSEIGSSISTSTSEHNAVHCGISSLCSGAENGLSINHELEVNKKQLNGVASQSYQETCTSNHASERDPTYLKGECHKQQNHLQCMVNCNGTVVSLAAGDLSEETLPNSSKPAASSTDGSDEKLKEPIVQRKGRFKVTSGSVNLEKVINQAPVLSSDTVLNHLGSSSSLHQNLHSLLQTNILQADYIINNIKEVSAGEVPAEGTAQISRGGTEISLVEAAHEREKELLQEITDLHLRLICAQDELQKLKARNTEPGLMRTSV